MNSINQSLNNIGTQIDKSESVIKDFSNLDTDQDVNMPYSDYWKNSKLALNFDQSTSTTNSSGVYTNNHSTVHPLMHVAVECSKDFLKYCNFGEALGHSSSLLENRPFTQELAVSKSLTDYVSDNDFKQPFSYACYSEVFTNSNTHQLQGITLLNVYKVILHGKIEALLRKFLNQLRMIPLLDMTIVYVNKTNIEQSAFDRKIQTYVIFIDFSRAYDTVPHHIIIQKLRSFCIDEIFISWITDYLSDRSFRVWIWSDISKSRNILAGLPQVAIISPFIFVLSLMILMKPAPYMDRAAAKLVILALGCNHASRVDWKLSNIVLSVVNLIGNCSNFLIVIAIGIYSSRIQ
ncbi:hypothetical protein GJ496_005836 [Pomphorhynchus laevis]|nr:hypothetical protein GJ496_005836 [Pomphorhynchus laevis]